MQVYARFEVYKAGRFLWSETHALERLPQPGDVVEGDNCPLRVMEQANPSDYQGAMGGIHAVFVCVDANDLAY